MANKEMSKILYEKMVAEQGRYRTWLLSLPPDEILNHANEYTVRENILQSIDYENMTDEHAWAMLISVSPLADLFEECEKKETGYVGRHLAVHGKSARKRVKNV